MINALNFGENVTLTDFLSKEFGKFLAEKAFLMSAPQAYAIGVISHRLDYAFRSIKSIDKKTKYCRISRTDFSGEFDAMKRLLGLNYNGLMKLYDRLHSEFDNNSIVYITQLYQEKEERQNAY